MTTAGGAAAAPRCSVVMPVYNTPVAYLRAAVESVLQQSFCDFELIVADDCSEPYVQELVAGYADPRLRYLRLQTRSGAAAARNRALDAARGEFVAFMDADDVSLPERLAKQVAYLDSHPEVSCLGTAYRIFDDQGFRGAPAVPREHEGIVSYLLFCGCAFCQSSVMLRRIVLEQPSPLRYREHFEAAHDCALWFDLIGRARFALLSEELVHYRVHSQSITCRTRHRQRDRMAEAQAELLARYCATAAPAPEAWAGFLAGATLAREDYAALSRTLELAARTLQEQYGYRPENVLPPLRARLRKAFLRTRSLRGQWELLRLPLRRYARVPLAWCIICLIIKGIL